VKQKVIVIGSGFAGLSAACHLAKKGYDVAILEKNTTSGGRARYFESDGFFFDMGPSWYWMPDVFEQFFDHFGKKPSDFYDLVRLDPSYRVYFDNGEKLDLSADIEGIYDMFDRIEPGSADELRKFMDESEYKYEVGINDLVYKPGLSLMEFADMRVVKGVFQLHLFSNISKYIRSRFRDTKLVQLLEFPVLFLGAKPQNTPALYSLMNYADMKLGTWYPMGGMHEIVKAMVSVAKDLGVNFQMDTTVEGFEIEQGKITAVKTNRGNYDADIVVAGSDYHHTEQLLEPQYRQYSDDYWDKRKLAPSSLIYYLGIEGEIPELLHHNLFFDESFDEHAKEIYETMKWPEKPLFYVSNPSKTDSGVAPENHENIFILIPVAPGIEEGEGVRDHYLEIVLKRIEKYTGTKNLADRIVYKRSFAHKEFIEEYNSFKGNAYGLANTLDQTAILKPRIKSKKLGNLFFTGQLTTPGPGVPPSLISGEVVSNVIASQYKTKAP
jgi:phytoene desaturase